MVKIGHRKCNLGKKRTNYVFQHNALIVSYKNKTLYNINL